MPGWHDATADLQAAGKVQMVGIIQEQHPDRCRLFMQWKEMGWPILVDSLNLLQVSLVPLTLAIDEHGVIRHTRLRVADAAKLEDTFLSQNYEAPRGAEQPQPPTLDELRAATARGGAVAWRRLAENAVLWGGTEELNEAIAAYEKALEIEPEDGWTHFRLGVTYRKRYDSSARQKSDFQRGVDHWSRALAIDPNNYIWRRRIQQYGPRLTKPYPFYDWVKKAREEVAARGETPAPLHVEPTVGELARPLRHLSPTSEPLVEPDPQGRIHRDPGRLVGIESTVVPATVAPGDSTRVHFEFRPQGELDAHWNNEVDELALWVELPQGWGSETRHLTYPNPDLALSREARTLELEIQAAEDTPRGRVRLPAYALYYVCEDVDGTCLYRRQDLEVEVLVDSTKDSG